MAIKVVSLQGVELHLCEKRAGCLQNLIGATQLLVLARELLEPVTLGCGQLLALAAISFFALDLIKQGLLHQALERTLFLAELGENEMPMHYFFAN